MKDGTIQPPGGERRACGLSRGQRVVYGALRAIPALLQLMSVRAAAKVGAAAGWVAFYGMRERRRIVTNNLRIVFGGGRDYSDCEALAREVFRRTGANFIGGFRAGLLSPARMAEVVEIRGLEHCRRALGEGRGVLLLLPHMGPWEVLAQVGGRLFDGAPHGSFYRPIDNPVVDLLVRKEREKAGARLFSRNEGMSAPVKLLREGGALGIVGDQRAGRGGVMAPFFGRWVSTTRLPYILHRKSGAPLLSLSVRTVASGRWVVTVYPPVFPEREGLVSREAFVRRCNELLERALRESIEDGFWFHRRWRPEQRGFFPVGAEQGAVARRALVVLPDDRVAASACARAVVEFGRERPANRFVIGGVYAEEVARETGFPADREHVLWVREQPGKREIAAAFAVADQLGPVGIDGALVFSGKSSLVWGKALRGAGMKTVLGPRSAKGKPLPGIHPKLSLAGTADDPLSYLAIFRELEAEQRPRTARTVGQGR